MGTRYLARRQLSCPRQDAELLLAAALECDRAFLFAHPETLLSPEQERLFWRWLRKRGRHYPIQYLTGRQEFYGRSFLVTPAVLIPRPETELAVETALELLQGWRESSLFALDIGTGSGAIAVSLALEDPRLRVTAVDISATALEVARRNALRLGGADRVEFLRSNVASALRTVSSLYHVVVCNPPYVAWERRREVDYSVLKYEPRSAVFAGENGLEVYRKVLSQVQPILKPNGFLVVELGHSQVDPVRRLGADYGWSPVTLRQDLSGIDRCLVFRPRGALERVAPHQQGAPGASEPGLCTGFRREASEAPR
ncbi:MAG: peptide chain release factor N(5)-glutamine methyltransferase [Acidobacteriota bacterium]